MKFKLFPNEQYDQQKEKHDEYIKKGLKLVKQYQDKDVVFREYAGWADCELSKQKPNKLEDLTIDKNQ